ncbi:restriction endonuclease [Actinosynnema sp. CS-041913]|uniref:restriction endonuclease n=1 Tax=Actinosynnema sp. CS-041913 TaxID=3239917 RepID=UPI003D927F65
MNVQNTKKKIDPNAYNALADALAVIYWNKLPWARYLRGHLKDYPELLAGLDLTGPTTKRETAGELIDRLMANESKYQSFAISLMLRVASMDSFPNLNAQVDRDALVAKATDAVAELRRWTRRHQEIAEANERAAAAMAKAAAEASRNRAFSESLGKLRDQFLEMHKATGTPQERGIQFEKFLNGLFGLFDLEPRAAYSLENEQIDGAFSFDTDDYILEARWWKKAIGRGHLDVFASKVHRKGKNALGLYVSFSGFSQEALDTYKYQTPFITLDGPDLMAVLDGRVRLDDLLKRKKRHANETGDCYFPVTSML